MLTTIQNGEIVKAFICRKLYYVLLIGPREKKGMVWDSPVGNEIW